METGNAGGQGMEFGNGSALKDRREGDRSSVEFIRNIRAFLLHLPKPKAEGLVIEAVGKDLEAAQLFMENPTAFAWMDRMDEAFAEAEKNLSDALARDLGQNPKNAQRYVSENLSDIRALQKVLAFKVRGLVAAIRATDGTFADMLEEKNGQSVVDKK